MQKQLSDPLGLQQKALRICLLGPEQRGRAHKGGVRESLTRTAKPVNKNETNHDVWTFHLVWAASYQSSNDRYPFQT